MIDPLGSQFAHNSLYAFQENKLGMGVELEGAELLDFYRGVVDAVLENSAPVATNYVKNTGNSSYNSGAKTGHYLSMALGVLQIAVGVSGDAAAGTAEVATAGVATPVALPLASVSTALIYNGGATFVKAAANLNSEGNKSQTGSYTNTHKSGKTYHGKGGEKRAADSGKQQAKANNDPPKSTDLTPAKNDREAFKQESRRLDKDKTPDEPGHKNPNNYNVRDSPGTKYRKQDTEN